MQEIKFYNGENIPLELQKYALYKNYTSYPLNDDWKRWKRGGFNTFRLKYTRCIPGYAHRQRNKRHERQSAGCHDATDDAYTGSQSFMRLQKLWKMYWVKIPAASSSGTCRWEYSIRSLCSQGVWCPWITILQQQWHILPTKEDRLPSCCMMKRNMWSTPTTLSREIWILKTGRIINYHGPKTYHLSAWKHPPTLLADSLSLCKSERCACNCR